MKLASIEKIDKIIEHPNADRLEIVKVLGYQCITEKNLHQEGDVIVYIQTDTILPEEEWAEGFRKYAPKRVKAVKLRGEWSEGIIVRMKSVEDRFKWDWKIGDEVAEELNVLKYEPPVPQEEGAIAGGLPYGIPKTDEERFENMYYKLPFGEKVDITLKIDGQSVTYGYNLHNDDYFVTGRRFQVDPNSLNRYTQHNPILKEKIINYCKKYNVSLAFRGENHGNGIQGSKQNPHSILPPSIAIFNVFNIDERRYEEKGSKHYFINACQEAEIPHVPLIEQDVVLTEELIKKYSSDLKKLNRKPFEGVVVKHSKGSFKIINKYYDSEK